MTTITLPRAVVEQALEAMQIAAAELDSPYTSETPEERVLRAAMDALRAALAQEQAEPVRCPASHVCDCQEAGQPCARAAPKPVQEQAEPFTPDAIHATQAAWKMGYEARRAEEAEPVQPVALVRTWHKGEEQHAELLDWGIGVDALPDGEHTLYTAPPQREPLTDEEIDRIRAAEREACAMFLERGVDVAGLAGDPVMQKYTVELLLGCAAAIRARSK